MLIICINISPASAAASSSSSSWHAMSSLMLMLDRTLHYAFIHTLYAAAATVYHKPRSPFHVRLMRTKRFSHNTRFASNLIHRFHIPAAIFCFQIHSMLQSVCMCYQCHRCHYHHQRLQWLHIPLIPLLMMGSVSHQHLPIQSFSVAAVAAATASSNSWTKNAF